MSAHGGDIAQLIEALARPGVLPGSGDGLTQVVQTHISAVFLTRDRAFKLKKPVDFGFLDFSTAEKRAHFCREEVRLNRRLAPEIYLGLSPVWRRAKGRLEVGPPVESPPPCDELLVAMERLPGERMMDRLLAQGRVERQHVERIARLVAAFHRHAETGPEVDRHGGREAAGHLALENFDQTERFCPDLFDPALHRAMRARTALFLESRERLFATRLRTHRICDGHGDLHSPNICLLEDGRPVIYDCIEFSPAYRCGDVASEIAFLAMDLDWRGHRDLSAHALATYAAEADDPTLEAMLPFYKAYRAMVRAKIAALTASAPEVSPELRGAQSRAARELFALAEEYTRGLVPAVLIALGGLTGVGKTAVADEIRTIAGIQPLETDRIRKSLAGLDPDVPAPAEPGEGIYTQSMTHATYRTLGREALGRLETGQAALAVGTFIARGQRDGLREVAATARVPFLFVRLTAPEDVVLKRLAARPPGMSDGNTSVYKVMAAREDPPTEIPDDQRFELETTGAAPRALAERILECARGSRRGAV